MISYLAIFQLPFLYLTLLMVGFGIYGNQLDTWAGAVYAAWMIAFVGLSGLARRAVANGATAARVAALAVGGIVFAVAAYRPMHLGHWDERSTMQAIWISGVGVYAALFSFLGAQRVRTYAHGHRNAQAFALLFIAIAWLTAIEFAMFPLVVIALVFALFCAFPEPAAAAEAAASNDRRIPAAWLGHAALLIGVDVGVMLWDFGLVRAWAPHLSIVFACAAAGLRLTAGRPRAGRALLGLGAINFAAAVFAPGYPIHPAHTAVAGLALGAILANLMRDRYEHGSAERVTKSLNIAWLLGLAISYGLMRNIKYLEWRLALLAPLVLLVRPHATQSSERTRKTPDDDRATEGAA